MLPKNTCEGVHLMVKLLAISLQACKFTKNELFYTYFSRILARLKVIIYCAFSRNHFIEGRLLRVSVGAGGEGGLFFRWLFFILKWEVRPMGGIDFDWGFSKKIVGGGGGVALPPCPPPYGKPCSSKSKDYRK